MTSFDLEYPQSPTVTSHTRVTASIPEWGVVHLYAEEWFVLVVSVECLSLSPSLFIHSFETRFCLVALASLELIILAKIASNSEIDPPNAGVKGVHHAPHRAGIIIF